MADRKELNDEELCKVGGGWNRTINPGIYNINGVNFFLVTQSQSGAQYNPVNGIALIMGNDGKLHKDGNATYNVLALVNKSTVTGLEVVD